MPKTNKNLQKENQTKRNAKPVRGNPKTFNYQEKYFPKYSPSDTKTKQANYIDIGQKEWAKYLKEYFS